MSLLDTDTLPHACTIRALSYAQDSLGGDSPSTTNRLTSQKCWIQPASRGTIIAYQRKDQTVTHDVYFGEDVACQVGEEIVASDGPFSGKILVVRHYVETTAGMSVGWRAVCEQKEDSRT